MTVLAIDAGNTRIKWGAHDGRTWLVTGAIATGDCASIGSAWSALGRIDAAIASNVAGPDVARDLTAACSARGEIGARGRLGEIEVGAERGGGDEQQEEEESRHGFRARGR